MGAITPVLTRKAGVDTVASSVDELAWATVGMSIDESMRELARI